ncbi:MAG: GtrA family protein [Oscillospiraceae bacterium]|nr:GtrA family protein [Oscillospiraceae bacterium]MBQ2794819.1 GtrA family protein [Oscillospiraceae bacterium]MBQ6700451.1 GtrA family protein [Oscillospiraceae bacterium]MBQ6801607.1 GtrA family protein [Oscillospiraceae bacterium]
MLKKFFELLKNGDIKGLFIEPTEDSFLQFFRYIFVGGASFAADYVLLHIITELGVYYLISGAISFIAGLFVNYALSKLLVFSKKTTGAEKAKEFSVFAVIAVFGLIITEALMWLFTEKLLWHYMISKAAAAVIVLFWNFFMKKILLYRKK